MNLYNLINIILIKKLVKSGKKRSCLIIINSLLILLKEESFFYGVLLRLMPPTQQYNGYNKFLSKNKYVFIHFYKSLSLALNWLIKGALIRKNRKMSLSKALYLECCDVSKKRGSAYMLRKNYLKQLINSAY